MSILQNAVDSIELGVEDFQIDTPKRLMSCVRNFHAGMLLLFKHKLALLSIKDDEALIKKDVVPKLEAGSLVWRGKGKKTVDVHQIQERFASLGINIDWSQIEKLQRYRNDIEHYHTDATPAVVRQYVSACFVVVRDFILEHLEAEPRTVLGEKTWTFLVEQENIYKGEQERCERELDRLEWPGKAARAWIDNAACAQCGSELLRPVRTDDLDAKICNFECVACGDTRGFEAVLAESGSPHEDPLSYKDGGGPVVGVCPECGSEGYDAVEGECAFCGEPGPYECRLCGAEIPVEELAWDSSGLCGYCNHRLSKDD